MFSGFSRRFAEALGLRYKVVNTLRQTRYVSGFDSNSFAARGGLTAKLAITDSLALNQNATVFYDSFNTSLFSLTALTAKVTGALSARRSFQINSESNPPAGPENADTTSRVTLVYAF